MSEQRLVKIAIHVLTGIVLGSNTFQNRMADRRAIAIGNACLAYRAKYHQYPAELKDLVPEFLPSVLSQNGAANILVTPGRWTQIVSRCCIIQRCRRLDDGSITWSVGIS